MKQICVTLFQGEPLSLLYIERTILTILTTHANTACESMWTMSSDISYIYFCERADVDRAFMPMGGTEVTPSWTWLLVKGLYSGGGHSSR